MRILFDHGTPFPLRFALTGYSITRTQDMGWDTLSNGELLTAAEQAGFELLLTTDKNIRYQQNLAGRKITIAVLGTSQWPVLRLHVQRVVAAVNAITPGSYTYERIFELIFRTCNSLFLLVLDFVGKLRINRTIPINWLGKERTQANQGVVSHRDITGKVSGPPP